MSPVLKQITQDMRREIGGVALVALGVLGYLALIFPHSGIVGRDLGAGLTWCFGLIAWLVPALIVVSGGLRLLNRPSLTSHRRGWAVLIGYVSGSLDVGMIRVMAAGHVGNALVGGIRDLIAVPGTVLLSLVLWVLAIQLWSGKSLLTGSQTGLRRLGHIIRGINRGGYWLWTSLRDWIYPEDAPAVPIPSSAPARTRSARPRPAVGSARLPSGAPTVPETPVKPSVPPPGILTHGINYLPPPYTLLAAPENGKTVRKGPSPMERAEVLATALKQFGIDVKLGEVNQGPTITRFEIIPPPGVKVSRIVNLADDIALSLAATGVRIEAPIPGKSAVGIE